MKTAIIPHAQSRHAHLWLYPCSSDEQGALALPSWTLIEIILLTMHPQRSQARTGRCTETNRCRAACKALMSYCFGTLLVPGGRIHRCMTKSAGPARERFDHSNRASMLRSSNQPMQEPGSGCPSCCYRRSCSTSMKRKRFLYARDVLSWRAEVACSDH